METLAGKAKDLVSQQPDIIYAPPAPAAIAARTATKSIPIVFATGTDPVGTGLVESLAKPGGNVTGAISVADSLAPKLIEILLQIMPAVKVVGLVGAIGDPRWTAVVAALAPVAARLGLTVFSESALNEAQLETAVRKLHARKAQALVTNSSISFNLRQRLMQLANELHLPVAGHRAELVQAGALFSYGGRLSAQLRRSAELVDKILRGADPASIPVEQPTQFDLVLNRRAAEAHSLVFPRALLASAERIIE
jgi:putative ABC transport system substrate-binding protein